MGTNNDVDITVFDGFKILGERIGGSIVGIKASDASRFKEFFEFRFEKFSAETFMDEGTVMANRTSGRDRFMMTTSVTNQLVGVTMKSERKKTVGAEGLIATVFAEREWGRATAIMKKQGLLVLFKIIFDVLK